MNVFEAAREGVNARQAAAHYGLKINRNGMACCPFHDDRNPSLKLGQRYYCFGFPYDKGRARPVVRAKPRKSDAQIFRETQAHVYRVLSDYYHLLGEWKTEYAPKSPDDEFHPYFVEALHETDHVAYLLDMLLNGDVHDRAVLLSEYGAKAAEIEKRMRQMESYKAA